MSLGFGVILACITDCSPQDVSRDRCANMSVTISMCHCTFLFCLWISVIVFFLRCHSVPLLLQLSWSLSYSFVVLDMSGSARGVPTLQMSSCLEHGFPTDDFDRQTGLANR